MDLEYILQSDKLLPDQKNKWKELDEFFKTNSKYYKSINIEDAVFLVYTGGAGGDFVLNTFFVNSLDKDHRPTLHNNRYTIHESYITLVSPILTNDNIALLRTLDVSGTFSESNDDNIKKNILGKANYFKMHSLPVIPYFYYKNFDIAKVININVWDSYWFEFSILLCYVKMRADEILSTVNPVFFGSSLEQRQSIRNVFNYVKNLLEPKENFKLIFSLIAYAVIDTMIIENVVSANKFKFKFTIDTTIIENVDDLVEKIINWLNDNKRGCYGAVYPYDMKKASASGRPWSGMLDFLSDDQMYDISYEDLFCNQNERVIIQLMEAYNSSQPIEYYVAEIKAYHERNLKLISKLNDEIVLALEILTNR